MFGLIGPDGAGKTTTIRLIGGLLRPDAGRVAVMAAIPSPSTRDHRAGRLSVAALQPVRRPEHRREHRVLRRDPRRPRLRAGARPAAGDDPADALPRPARRSAVGRHEAEARARLHARARAERSSCSTSRRPASIPVSRREFWKLLAEFLGRGLTILMATPYLDEAERCTRVALLHDGHAARARPPVDAAGHAARSAARGDRGDAAPARRSAGARAGVADVQSFGDRAHVRVGGTSQAAGADAHPAALAERIIG